MKRLAFFRSSATGQIAVASIRIDDQLSLHGRRNAEIDGWILKLDSGVQAIDLIGRSGEAYPCDVVLGIPSPQMARLYPECAHSGSCRVRLTVPFHDDLAAAMDAGLRIVVSFGDGTRLDLGKIATERIHTVLGAGDRMPTSVWSVRFLQSKGLRFNTVIDVGVQHGTPELIQLFPNATHVLFEPVAENYPFIARSYKDIRHRLVKAAAYSSTGTGQLRISRVENSPKLMSRISGETGIDRREVSTIRLDDFFGEEEFPTPYYLKIDVDGNEPEVIEGAKKTLESCHCVSVEASVSNVADRIAMMEREDFHLWDIVDLGYLRNALAHFDMIFLSGAIYRNKDYFPDLDASIKPNERKRFLH